MNLLRLHRPVLSLALLTALLAGCASGPPQPAWIPQTGQLVGDYRLLSLRGQEELAAKRLNEAKVLLQKAGDIQGYWRLQAHQDAVRIATGQPLPPIQNQWRDWAPPKTMALLRFYRSPFRVEPDHLPESYQSFARSLQKNDPANSLRSLESIKDPFRRLVCTRLYLHHTGSPATEPFRVAIDTAAHWGWTTPLLQLLEECARYLEKQQYFGKAERLRQRIAFIRQDL